MSNKRALLFTMGGWSHSNDAIVAQLENKLPRWRIRTVDLLRLMREDKRSWLAHGLDMPLLAWNAIGDHGFDKNNILYAPATSRFINHLARRITNEFQPDFTIQTTTRFNAASGEVPHFTIIDVTMAAVRQRYLSLYHPREAALDRMHEFQKQVFESSTGIFAMGKYVRDSLIWDYLVPPDRAFAIGAGPNIALGPRSPVVGSRKILFVGTNWERKGGPALLEAFRQLRHYHPQAELYIVGCTPNVHEEGVYVVGRVAREDLHLYFSSARVFALPTQLEAFGIAFVEALHFGLPIIATPIGAIPEIVENGVNGFLVKPGNADSIARALDKLFSSDETALQFGEASYQRAPRFTWDHTGSVLCQKMLELVKQHPVIPKLAMQKFHMNISAAISRH